MMYINALSGGRRTPSPGEIHRQENTTLDSFEDVFLAVKEYCKERVTTPAYTVFFQRLEIGDFDGATVVIVAHADFIRTSLSSRYMALLKEAFMAILGFEVEIDIQVKAPEAAPAPAPAPAQETADAVKATTVPGSAPEKVGGYAFNFENFIVGSNNKFAHAAAQAVAANPSGAYNPLFIYGPSGLGKTHLLTAIRLEIQKNHPDFNILYVDGEAFTNEIITAIRDNSTAEFHQKYRAADVLLVDDIQFIGSKDSTQEEFFHTFNTLYNAGKQIVLASDRPPKEIKSLEDRLRTRFEWGLTADIQPPDFETRVAIIKRKAGLLGMELPEEVCEFIAKRLKNNIRQLEGAVKKMSAYRSLSGIHPTIGAAQNAIKDILSETQPVPVTIEKIMTEVARCYNITVTDIRSRKRTANISDARKTAMYCIREITGMSMEDIGKECGGRDHSTVVYSIKAVEEQIDTNSSFKEMVEDILKNTRAN